MFRKARKAAAINASVPNPCPQPWEQMCGDHRQRRCDHCNQTIHNFSAMSIRQIEKLVLESAGHLCARVQHHADGSLVTLDSIGGVRPAPRFAAMALAATMSFATANSFAQQPDANQPVITGTVLDPMSYAVPNAKIEIVKSGVVVAAGLTNHDGKFVVHVPAGHYAYEISAPGFANTSDEITISSGEIDLPPIKLSVGRSFTGIIVVKDTRPWYQRWPHHFWFGVKHPVSVTKSVYQDVKYKFTGQY